MKKIITIITILAATLLTIPVHAANYEMRELIPVDTKTTIVTEHFSYQDFYYNDNKMEASTLKNNFIIFGNIKNISDEELPVSISVGLFDADKKNIGIVNYCSTFDKVSVVAGTILKPEEEKTYVIEVNKKYLPEDKSVNDIKYIAILSENINCRVTGSQEFIGKKVEDIKIGKTSLLENSTTKLFLKIITVLIGVGIIIFLYKFLFTNSFRNFDGDDVRREFVYKNKQLAKERENNPPEIKEQKPLSAKSNEVKTQELNENKNSNKEGTDLHNLYK